MCDYLQLKSANCKHCYKCIRHCPVKAISFSPDQSQMNIIEDDCVLCGACLVNCPQHAKSFRNDIAEAKQLIESGEKVYASIAPSFLANCEEYGIASVRDALKKLGFEDASETAVGASLVRDRYDELVLDRAKRDVVISSCCHSVNMLIQKYFSKALPYLAPVLSPMQAHSKMIKSEHPGAKTVFIGPCISKKAEADEYRAYEGSVDCVLTFDEMFEWLGSEDVVLEKLEKDAAGEYGCKASFFPITGGILRSMAEEDPDYTYVAVDGIGGCSQALRDILDGNIRNCFIEMSACEGSCIGGPVALRNGKSPMHDYLAVDRYAAAKTDLTFGERYGGPDFLSKTFQPKPVRRVFPGKAAIDEVLESMGKTRPEDELNCGFCGYDTCRDKALAVVIGKADRTMCLPYLMKRAESFSDNIVENSPNGLIVLDGALTVQRINPAARKIMNIRRDDDVIGMEASCILDPVPVLHVVESGQNRYEQRVYMPEYRRYVMQSVIHDGENDIVIVFMRDITDEEEGRTRKIDICRQTIEITDKVIEKQMRSVQEIASLLGETTAETQIALTKLKETLHNEQFLH